LAIITPEDTTTKTLPRPILHKIPFSSKLNHNHVTPTEEKKKKGSSFRNKTYLCHTHTAQNPFSSKLNHVHVTPTEEKKKKKKKALEKKNISQTRKKKK